MAKNFEKTSPDFNRYLIFERYLSWLIPLAFFFIVGFINDSGLISLITQIAIGCLGALSVYILIRMDLISFATPAFMGVGGFAAAIVATKLGITNLFIIAFVSFMVPVLIALPIGAFVLRLRGIYFVLVTFLLSEIFPLIIFETPSLTGGSNGISGLPILETGFWSVATNNDVARLACALLVIGVLLSSFFTTRYHSHINSIRYNETLAQSFGLISWHYKLAGFCLAAGIAGLAGMALVNMLLTAHPSSFEAISSVSYVAYVIIGGRDLIIGVLFGSTILIWLENIFSFEGTIANGLFGLILIAIMLLAQEGIAGAATRVAKSVRYKLRNH